MRADPLSYTPVNQPPAPQLNEAVNFDRETIFIAVPKAGSTSIRAQLAPEGPFMVPGFHLDIRQVRDCLYPFLLSHALGRNDHFPDKHARDDADIRGEAEATFRAFFKFGGVRNPWARTVSMYFRKEGMKVSEHMSFERFCELIRNASDTCVRPTRHRDQADWLTDETGRIAVDYVFRLEELPGKYGEIREASNGRVDLKPVKMLVNPRSRSEAYRELYDARTRALIGRTFERDIDLFKYAF